MKPKFLREKKRRTSGQPRRERIESATFSLSSAAFMIKVSRGPDLTTREYRHSQQAIGIHRGPALPKLTRSPYGGENSTVIIG